MSKKINLNTFVEERKSDEIKRKINILIKSRFTLASLKKSEVLLYDIEVASFYLKMFKKVSYETLDTRLKKIHIFSLLKALLTKIKYNKLTLKQCYILEQIKDVNPKYLISFTNVDIFFWTLKKYFPRKKFLVFQTGAINGHTPNPFSSFKEKYNVKFKVDYVFTWGKNLFKMYKDCLDCNLFDSGSLLNNFFLNKKLTKKKSRYIIFISQYKKSSVLLRTQNNDIVSQKETFHKHREHLLKIISKFCKSKKFKLRIFPRSYDLNGWLNEKDYYEKMFKDIKLPLMKRSGKNDIYKCLAEYQNFITIDSSSGYEALARGKRVCFLNIKYSFSKFINAENHRYGWPKKLPINFAFWSSSHEKEHVENALNFAFLSSKNIWKKIKINYVDPIITFDPKNKKLLKKMKDLNLKINIQ